MVEQVHNVILYKQGTAHNSDDLVSGLFNAKLMFDDVHEAESDDRHTYLDTDSVLADTPKHRHSEMLFDPSEKQFHLPSTLVQVRYFASRKIEIVRVIDKRPLEFWGIVYNPSDLARIVSYVVVGGKLYSLVGQNIVFTIKQFLSQFEVEQGMSLFSNHKEGSNYVDTIKPGKIVISSVKDVASMRFVGNRIHRIDIVDIRVGYPEEGWNLKCDVEHRMHFDARLGAFERSEEHT